MEIVERVEFRYTNRFVCYLTQVVGMALLAAILYSVFGITIEHYLSDIPILYPVVLIVFGILSFIIVVSIPMLIGIKISDRYAYADFYSEKVVISLWSRKITVSYVGIKQIDWYWIQFGSNKRSSLKRKKNYRLKIYKALGSVTIAASFMETNDIIKSGRDLSLKIVSDKLRFYSRQKLKDCK